MNSVPTVIGLRFIGAGTTFPIKAKPGDVFEHILQEQEEEDDEIVGKYATFIFTGEKWNQIEDYHILEESEYVDKA